MEKTEGGGVTAVIFLLFLAACGKVNEDTSNSSGEISSDVNNNSGRISRNAGENELRIVEDKTEVVPLGKYDWISEFFDSMAAVYIRINNKNKWGLSRQKTQIYEVQSPVKTRKRKQYSKNVVL